MLWLRRQAGESITMPTLNVEIVVLEINGNTARVGVRAPDAVSIYRGEVWRAMQRDDEASELQTEE
jgi:carbon storage regulator CsrA